MSLDHTQGAQTSHIVMWSCYIAKDRNTEVGVVFFFAVSLRQLPPPTGFYQGFHEGECEADRPPVSLGSRLSAASKVAVGASLHTKFGVNRNLGLIQWSQGYGLRSKMKKKGAGGIPFNFTRWCV